MTSALGLRGGKAMPPGQAGHVVREEAGGHVAAGCVPSRGTRMASPLRSAGHRSTADLLLKKKRPPESCVT